VKSLAPSAGVYLATISGFITKPPAAMTVVAARTTPVSSKERQASPTTAPDSAMTRPDAPVSYLTSTPASAIRSRSRSITSLVPPVSPGTGTLCPRGAGFAMSQNGQTFSLPVNMRPSVPGWMTAFPGKKERSNRKPSDSSQPKCSTDPSQ
jgi:hypothetical protein